jgi:hypothetical protein
MKRKMTEKRKVQIENQEIEFIKSDDEWFGVISLPNDRQIEITIKSDNFMGWAKTEIFLFYFVTHCEEHVAQSLLPLKTLAKATKFFPENAIDTGNFIVYGIEIFDNSFSIGDNWEFELRFEFDNGEAEPIDPYGYWFATFSNKGIIGIRREQG